MRTILHRLKDTCAQAFADRRLRRLQRKIDRIAKSAESFAHLDDEDLFAGIQESMSPPPEYGYDAYSTWERAARRCAMLLQRAELRDPGQQVLEATCGDGMCGLLLQTYGHRVTLSDLKDWRDARAGGMPFIPADLCISLPLDSNSQDVILSFNAFEHVSDPAIALKELVRVAKPGGLIYLEFGPLYCSPWGLHAYRTIHIPYAQFLFSDKFLARKMQELGIRDLGAERMELQPLNRWRPGRFLSLWKTSGCVVESESSFRNLAHLDMILKYPAAFQGRGLAFDDLTIQGISVLLRKPDQ